jgi:hypothetical protein
MLFVMLSVGILSLGVLALAWSSWQTKSTLQKLLRQQELSSPAALSPQYPDLTRQVSEIQQTMGGVVNDLKAVGHQVYHLNQLAGQALQGSEMMPDEEGLMTPQIMIEIHQRNPNGLPGEAPRIMAPEDMPPEMLEKFRTFQSIYMELYNGKIFPSQRNANFN